MKKKANNPTKTEAQATIEPAESGEVGRYAYEGLDRTIHEKARLGIMTSLAAHPNGLLFGDLKELCSLTDGNLSRHLQVLQESQFVEVWKRFQLKRPQTLCRLTDLGRDRLLAYIDELERIVAEAAALRANSEASSRILARSVAAITLPGMAPS